MFFDMLAIPADAPHPHNAHVFINYLLRPEVAAKNSALMHYATSNAAAYSLVRPGRLQRSGHLSERGTESAPVSERLPQHSLHARAESNLDALQDRDT